MGTLVVASPALATVSRLDICTFSCRWLSCSSLSFLSLPQQPYTLSPVHDYIILLFFMACPLAWLIEGEGKAFPSGKRVPMDAGWRWEPDLSALEALTASIFEHGHRHNIKIQARTLSTRASSQEVSPDSFWALSACGDDLPSQEGPSTEEVLAEHLATARKIAFPPCLAVHWASLQLGCLLLQYPASFEWICPIFQLWNKGSGAPEIRRSL